jgi:thioredoxin reductase (NADPH)
MDAEHYRLRDFLTRTAQPYEWHEADSAEADLLLASLGLVDAALPVLVDGDRTFTAATVETIAAAWGGLQPPKRAHYDFAVIGAGPAGSPSTQPPTVCRRSFATGTCQEGRPRTRP